MSLASALHELRALIASYHPLVVMETYEEARASELVRAASKAIGTTLYEWSIAGGLHYAGSRPQGNPIASTREPAVLLRHIRSLDRAGIYLLKDFATHLDDPEVARLLREACQDFAENSSCIILTGGEIQLSPELDHHATYLPLALPSESELAAVVREVIDSLAGMPGLSISLRPDEQAELVRALRGMTRNQARQAVAYAAFEDGRLDASDQALVVERKAQVVRDSGLLEYFPAPSNAFEIGGFAALGEWLDRAEHGFTDAAAALNIPAPKGLLLVGVQGCGKSLAAKTIARRWQQPLLKLDAGRLYDKYIGESERNLRRALDLAEAMAPAVLWIDEIEKGFSTAGEASNDGGLSRRLQGMLLTWMQEKQAPVFVVATANDVFSLPPEMMRKGRFDEVFFVDLPHPPERRQIFEIHLRHRNQDPAGFRLEDLVLASDGFSGAEIEQAVVAALYRSLHSGEPLDDRQIFRELDGTVPLSRSRREDVERLRALASERFVNVSGSGA